MALVPASDAAHANSILYTISGNAITLGAGGLTDEMSNDNTAQIDSLVLAADQTWTLHGGENFGVNNPLTATSLTNPASLEVNLGGVDGNGPTLDLFGDNEIGATTFTGADPAQTGQHAGNNGIVVLTPDDSGNASLNTTTGKPVTFTNVELDGQARFPALTVHGGDIQVGNQPVGSSGTLGNVQAKSVNLDSGTLVDFPISGPASGSPTAGTDYSQIKATGAVDLGGAQLAIENFDTDARFCPAAGSSYEFITGSNVTGHFSDTGGTAIPDGGVIPLTCPDTTKDSIGLSIGYSAGGVTATSVSPPPGADSSNSASTTDPSQPATANDSSYAATASGGTGTVIVSVYGGDPAPSDLPNATGSFFDVRLASGSTFTQVVETVDGVPSDATLSWFNPATSAWEKVVGDPGPTVTGGKLSVTLDAKSSPNLTQLGGTNFGVASPSAAPAPTPSRSGYRLFASDGGVFSFGGAPFFGSMGGKPLNQPIVGGATAADGRSYYMVASDGGIFSFGPGAQFSGSTGGIHLNKPIVGMAVDPATGGYWLVAADGGVFAFNAPFLGSMATKPLNQPIVGIANAPDGNGYYLVARDGGIFAFGSSAKFQGSTGGMHLNKPIVGMTVDPATGGYWLAAADGGVFSFNAPFLGSTGNITLNKPVVGMAVDPGSGGYRFVASDGGVFAFGAPFQGSTGNITLTKPVVGLAAG